MNFRNDKQIKEFIDNYHKWELSENERNPLNCAYFTANFPDGSSITANITPDYQLQPWFLISYPNDRSITGYTVLTSVSNKQMFDHIKQVITSERNRYEQLTLF